VNALASARATGRASSPLGQWHCQVLPAPTPAADRYDILQLPNGLTSVTNSVPYGTQIVISTIGAAIVVLIARFLGGRSA
jgi:hypothetical protein